MAMAKVRLFVLTLFLLLTAAFPAMAGMDSAGTASLGSYTETDVLTNGGTVVTGGGDVDLENGDLLGVQDITTETLDATSVSSDAVDATKVTAYTIDASTVSAESVGASAISNPNAEWVKISDSVVLDGGTITGVSNVQITKTTPTAANEVTSKSYVDKVAADVKAWAAANVRGSLYYCEQYGGNADMGWLGMGYFSYDRTTSGGRGIRCFKK